MMKRVGGLLLLVLCVAGLALATKDRPVDASHLCGATGSPFGPFDLQTYEDGNYKNTYARALELAGYNRLFPELPGFALPRLETGDRSAGSGQTVDPYIPPVILKSIAYLESGWAQASYDPPVQYGEVGPVLVSHDCGYGIMQVTTGMQNVSGAPNQEQAMIGGHYAFNMARGARILAEKWNLPPEYRPIVGARNPGIIEDWYYALWGYNGFAFKNHPLNSAYDPNRPPYACAPNGYSYPYQELVLGCVANPPTRAGVRLWDPVPVHLPDLSQPALSVSNWNACSYSLDCAAMDMPTPNPWHADPTQVSVSREQIIGSPMASVSSNPLSFQSLPGQQSLSTNVTIGNAGSGPFAWTVSLSASWIRVSPLQGVSLGSNLGSLPQSVRVFADATQLAPGNHGGTLTVQSLYAGAAPVNIPVTVNVSLQTTQETGDFNGDGKTDVAYLCCGGSTSIWLSNGDGTFTQKSFQPWDGYNTQSGTWKSGDFDGDSKTDLIHLCCSGYAQTWLSKGDGTFRIFLTQAWAGYEMRSGTWLPGDFDGDGRTDLAHMVGGYWNVWTSNGDGSFRLRAFFPWQGYETRSGFWRSADVTGDGKDDLVHLCCQDYANSWISDGHGGFMARLAAAPAGDSMVAGRWATGDFNGDQRKDFLQTGTDEYARSWLSNGDGTYSVVPFRPWPGYGMGGSWQVGDFNKDGKDDAVHLCCSDYVETWLSTGDGAYTVMYFRPWPGYGIASGSWQRGDFSGDGRTDLLHVCCYYANQWTASATMPGKFGIRTFFP